MPFSIPDHKASAEESLEWGLMKGKLSDLGEVPEPQQSSEHQARVMTLTVFHNVRLGNDLNMDLEPWAAGKWKVPEVVEPEPPIEPPVEPPSSDWGDGKAFGTRPASGVIHLKNQNNVIIDNKHFVNQVWMPGKAHNAHVSILLENCRNITIRNCDFMDVSEPVAVIGGSDILVEYCRVDGIVGPGSRVNEQTGNFLQTVNRPARVRIRHNKIIATTTKDPWNGKYQTMTEDVISLFSANDCVVEYNQIDASGYTRDSGTGIIAGDALGNNHVIRGNTLLNPGQVGLACAGGFGHRFYDNIIYKDASEFPGSGNTAAYFWGYNGNPIGDGVFSGNRAKWNGGGGFWNPGGAQTLSNNWNDNSINRADLVITL